MRVLSYQRQEEHFNVKWVKKTHTPQVPEVEFYAENNYQVVLKNECIQETDDS